MPASISAITRLRSASARAGVQPSLARPSLRDCRRPSMVMRSQKLASARFLNGLMSIEPVTGRPAPGLSSLRARGMDDLVVGLLDLLELDQPHPPPWAPARRRRLLRRLGAIEGGDRLGDDLRVEPEPGARSVSEPHGAQLALVC